MKTSLILILILIWTKNKQQNSHFCFHRCIWSADARGRWESSYLQTWGSVSSHRFSLWRRVLFWFYYAVTCPTAELTKKHTHSPTTRPTTSGLRANIRWNVFVSCFFLQSSVAAHDFVWKDTMMKWWQKKKLQLCFWPWQDYFCTSIDEMERRECRWTVSKVSDY